MDMDVNVEVKRLCAHCSLCRGVRVCVVPFKFLLQCKHLHVEPQDNNTCECMATGQDSIWTRVLHTETIYVNLHMYIKDIMPKCHSLLSGAQNRAFCYFDYVFLTY